MSEKNDGANRDATKRSARERLQAERERQKTRDKRRRTMIVAAAVVGVLGLATVVGVIAANAGKGDKSDSAGPVVAPSGATGKDALAIQTGKPEAKSTLTVWEDFRCPACKSFEDNYRDTVHELEAKGLLKVDYHLVTLIDGNMGGSGSLKGANAAACAQDAGKFSEYHDVLFQNQPQEVDDAYGKNARLLELAGKVEGLDTPEFRKCVEDGTHNSWVAKSHEAFAAGNFRGTPTVLLDGKDIFSDQANPLTPQKLKEKVEAGAKGSGGAGAGAKGTEKETGKESGKDAGKDTGKGEAKASPSASRTASTASKGTPSGSGTRSGNTTGNGSSGD
ncbi:membrane protein [Streptomyces virginiae]|uniref:Membrane protein n=1 Tax=Streptomyces virginiae TaxID=1961 RepID=A0ABQ3NYZ1_STRVG|nr:MULTISPECIES: thioredoxin domain-containing protein [Streptomyces]MBP2343592.1 protein-disulfide isomerase [Streptomyces virginiae]MCI4080994.1 thioredoxin domain-containing protein [Streptomyces sp. MMS21 TC-5]GGQ37134.1 membrane protein [Streptomyces virginiae]GHI17979.1 membrane protein [Streptomyces virginiae]